MSLMVTNYGTPEEPLYSVREVESFFGLARYALSDPPVGLLVLTVEALREYGDSSASGLLARLPLPWSGFTPSQLGIELKARGLTSRHRRTGNFYCLEDATTALHRVRHDPVTPLSPVKNGDGLVEDREGAGDGPVRDRVKDLPGTEVGTRRTR